MAAARSKAKLVKGLSKSAPVPAGKAAQVIDIKAVRALAAQAAMSPLQAEIYCLENGVVPARYLRNIGTVGIKGQIKLLSSTVAVCGVGGLGGTIVELLARQGVGRLIIIDKGRFVENNLNRQIMATEADLRRSKVKVAAQHVKKINSAISVTAVNRTIDRRNAGTLLKGADLVIDALDSFATRRIVADACRKLKIPFIHGAIAGLCGQLATVFPGDKGFESICGSPAGSDCGLESVTGNPPATPAVIAAWQVQEAVKIITGTGKPLRNRLIFIDFSEDTFREIDL